MAWNQTWSSPYSSRPTSLILFLIFNNSTMRYIFLIFCSTWRHFNFFVGGQIFFYFSMPPDYWKIGKKQLFICSNLTLFIVPFFLSFFFFFFFSLFSFFSFFFFFFLGGRRPPAPLKWRPWSSDLAIMVTKTTSNIFLYHVLQTVCIEAGEVGWE